MADKVPVFGKSITEYLTEEPCAESRQNAVPCDVTDAFRRAFADIVKGANTLLTVPAGDYILNETLVLPNNLFLDVHPHAEIDFCGFESEENAENIHIRGGIFRLPEHTPDRLAFSFSNANHITLENAKLYFDADTAVGFCGGSDLRLENCSFYGLPGNADEASTGILFGGLLEDVVLEGLYAHGCDRLMEFTPHTVLKHFSANRLSGDDCLYFLYAENAVFERVVLHELSGCAHADAVYLADCDLQKLEMRGLDLHNGFFVFEHNKIGNVRIERFRRRYDLDKNAATKATLTIAGQACAIDADIVSLDSILRTGKLCPHVKLNAARRSSPLIQPDTPFVYRFNAKLSADDTYIMPSGSFDSFHMRGTPDNP